MSDIDAADLSGRHVEHYISVTDKDSPPVTGLILWAVTHEGIDDPGVVRLTVGVWRDASCVIEVPSEWPVTVGSHMHEVNG